YNDVVDRDADIISAPSRPIPSGALSWRTASLFSGSCLTVGVGCGFAAGWRSGLLAVLLAVVSVVYSSHIKRVLLLGNVWVAVTSASSALFGSLLAGRISVLA